MVCTLKIASGSRWVYPRSEHADPLGDGSVEVACGGFNALSSSTRWGLVGHYFGGLNEFFPQPDFMVDERIKLLG